MEKLFSHLLDHVKDTENPQTYIEHGKFAFINSSLVAWAGLQGMIHAFCPWWFKFSTSTAVIKSFKKLVDSRRHLDELNDIMPNGYIMKKHLK